MSKKNKKGYLLPSERQNQPEEPKKERKILKKTLKFTGLFFLSIVVIVTIGVLGTWLSGRFDPKKIYITSLSINNQKEYVAISQNDTSFKTKVDFLPAEANQLVLTPKIITGSDLIQEMPVIKAGEEFEIKFAKDQNGITKGGEIEIKFLDSSQSAYTTLKVLIDVGLNSDYVNVESSGTEMEFNPNNNTLSTKVTTSVTEEYCEVITISANHNSMFNSYTGNWSESENNSVANLNRLKKTILHYDKTDTSIVGFGENKELVVEEELGEEKAYKIRFLSPASSLEPFKLELYIYKTYHMETLFSDALARSILNALDTNSFSIDDVDYTTLNAFINSYVYHSSSTDVKNNFELFINTNNGLIELMPSKISGKIDQFRKALNDVLDYVFVGKRILITVENVEITDIVNQYEGQAIEFKVLKDQNYGIAEVKNTLGVSLSSVSTDPEATPADPEVLYNNLRKLDIFLVEKCTGSDYELANTLNFIDTTSNYYFVEEGSSTTVYKRVAGDKNASIELVKGMVDGVATWKIKTLSPISGNLYLMYRYRNNDVTEIEYTNPGTLVTDTYQLINDIWYRKANTARPVNSRSTLFGLNKLLNDVFSLSTINITYTAGSISFNTNENVENRTTSTFVLNEENSIFTYDGTEQKRISHGEEGGVYYATNDNGDFLGRTFTIGEGYNNSENNVIINPQVEGQQMEYTMVKWFVPYYQNIVGAYNEEGIFSFSDEDLIEAQYYFMPVLESAYDNNYSEGGVAGGAAEGYYNPIPAKVRIKSVDTGYIFGGEESYFMEVGTGNLTLKALNAMSRNLNIPLYAVIIQTDINNNPYFTDGDVVEPNDADKFTTPKQITYHYVAYTSSGELSGHTLNIKAYVDSLKLYLYSTSVSSNYVQASDTASLTLRKAEFDGDTRSTGYFYLSNIDISVNSEVNKEQYPLADTDVYGEGNIVILNDAINNLRNKQIALYNYYSSFFTGSKPAYVVSVPEGSNYPTANSYRITIEQLSEDMSENWFIKIEVTCVNIGDTGRYTYDFRTEYLYPYAGIYPPISAEASVHFYTQVETQNLASFTLDGTAPAES